MSHVTVAKGRIHNLDALKMAAEARGLKFSQQPTYRWWGQWENDYSKEDAAYKQGIDVKDYGKRLYALVNPNKNGYDCGVVAAKDGNGYQLVFDFIGGGRGLVDLLGGKDAAGLMQTYTEVITLLTVQAEGHQVLNQVTDNTGATYITVEV